MTARTRTNLFVALAVALLLGIWWLGHDPAPALAPSTPKADAPAAADPAQAQLGDAGPGAMAASSDLARQATGPTAPPTGVRGIVVDQRTGAPLAGVEVLAVADEPGLEPLVARFRGLFQGGMYTETRAPRRELGRTLSGPDGQFEILGLPPGRVFLDGRSDGWFVRTPGTARLAHGEVQTGLELRASPGGRVRGIVLGADGGPAPFAHVHLRPGLNAFFGQLTERQYRWLETTADAQGRFDLPGVPPGQGYTASASATGIALEEQFGIAVAQGQVTELTLRGHTGATVSGRVLDAAGQPVAAAAVAMVYLDISRVLFSADGKSAPIVTDERGAFRIEHIAAGRVAFVAAAADLAPSAIEELAVVDGGRYEDLVLQLDTGATIQGRVLDDLGQPVAAAQLELRPFERPNDPQFLKMMLKIRRVSTESGADGRFTARGLTGERLVVQAQKPGYATTMRFGVKLDDPDLVIELQRGVVVRGRVEQDGAPVPRFRVETRTRALPAPGTEAPAATADARPNRRTDGQSAPTWANDDNGMRMRFGRGGEPPTGTLHLPEGQTLLDRGIDGNWREVADAAGHFELRGIPPGRVRVRVRGDGQLDATEQEIDLQPGQTSAELLFQLAPGLLLTGTVVDDTTGLPISDAQVTAYPQRTDRPRNGLFAVDLDPEDFDFLALAAATGRRSAISDSKGRFRIDGLAAGTFRVTARHPDLAKASAKDVRLEAAAPPPDVQIRLGSGGGVEGLVTGRGQRPLADALMVAFSLQTGTVRSHTSDARGHYAIDGLPPGQYLVFKSRLDERADNIPLELLSNMRLKATTVKAGKLTRVDVHDESDDGVRVFGTVREGPTPVPRALVTLLGSDRDGILGMGVRSGAAGLDGRYELTGIKPGTYALQVTRFLGQPLQSTFEIEVPGDSGEFLFDIVLPTSELSGTVVDTRGQVVAGIQVSLASEQGTASSADGLLGLIAQGGFAQARTDGNGAFRLRAVAAGTYRLTAGAPRGRRGGGATPVHGEGSLSGITVDGIGNVQGLVVTVPLAGRITGLVLDGSGQPVANAEIACVATGTTGRKSAGNPLFELLRAGNRAIRTGDDGRFTVPGLTPGRYDLRVESEALEAGKALDVPVAEDGTSDVTLRMVRGARLRVRATNVAKERIPLAQISLLDGQGKAVVSRVSTLSVMKRFLAQKDEVADSGWYEFGSVPPDTYTAVIAEKGKPELRIVRTIADGETVEWEVDVGAELARRER
ncbi:MAG: carboxypeptidase regulatory-like domain-containing protein [Planctomycetes bacterium]|nr:carboxypeptidase regulatory-like domain-containing protein [Planctomycetota bacterium]